MNTYSDNTDAKITAKARIGFAPIGGSFNVIIDTESGVFCLDNMAGGSREDGDIRDEVNDLIARLPFTPEVNWVQMAWDAAKGARQWARLTEAF